jgi:hypothetical protein
MMSLRVGVKMSLDRLQKKECKRNQKQKEKGKKPKKKKHEAKNTLDVCIFARTNFLGEV